MPASVPAAIVGGATAPARAVPARPGGGLGEAEVGHLHLAVGRQLDVRGLQVAVDDAVLVGLLERLGDLLRDRDRLVHGDRAALQPLRRSSPSTSSIARKWTLEASSSAALSKP